MTVPGCAEPDIYAVVEELLAYGRATGLLTERDTRYARNRLLSVLDLGGPGVRAGVRAVVGPATQVAADTSTAEPGDLSPLLESILHWAESHERVSSNTRERDGLSAHVMDCLLPRPSEIAREFDRRLVGSAQAATDYLYHLSLASDYVRTDRIARNQHWTASTDYGVLDITVNLSKPELDPKDIERAAALPAPNYPKCSLCIENEGFRGNLQQAPRANLRLVPVRLRGEPWYLQYSPYAYFNEHCILIHPEHVPMEISRRTFERLLACVELFPHYFMGSNSDLPITGGSILSHDHFQGGRFSFPIERAVVEQTIHLPGLTTATVEVLKWPMPVFRVRGPRADVLRVASVIWRCWRDYSDADAKLVAHTGGERHNTLTPIARRRGQLYELDVVLRNNRTTPRRPYGLFHPRQDYHHIKKENIGLIEVMGLAILPGRLAPELALLRDHLLHPQPRESWEPQMLKHWTWYEELQDRYPDLTTADVDSILHHEVGQRFAAVLEDAGVFKRTSEGRAALARFIDRLRTTWAEQFQER